VNLPSSIDDYKIARSLHLFFQVNHLFSSRKVMSSLIRI